MSDSYVGEIIMVGFDAEPAGWRKCDGQLISESQAEALFFLIKYQYGGSGNNFNLPDMRGRVPYGSRNPGEKGGATQVSLSIDNLPPHDHPVNVSTSPGTASTPGGKVPAKEYMYGQVSAGGYKAPMQSMVTASGEGLVHDNIMPSLGLNFLICLEGVFPPRH